MHKWWIQRKHISVFLTGKLLKVICSDKRLWSLQSLGTEDLPNGVYNIICFENKHDSSGLRFATLFSQNYMKNFQIALALNRRISLQYNTIQYNTIQYNTFYYYGHNIRGYPVVIYHDSKYAIINKYLHVLRTK